MTVEVQVPRLAESISDAVLVEWLREDGAAVRADEPIATLETDKAAVEISATEAGVLRHARGVGDKVLVGDVIARIEAGPVPSGGNGGASSAKPAAPKAKEAPAPAKALDPKPATALAAAPPPAAQGAAVKPAGTAAAGAAPKPAAAASAVAAPLSPAVRRIVEEHQIDTSSVLATGRGGRLLKSDVMQHVETVAAAPALSAAAPAAEVEPTESMGSRSPALAPPSAAPSAPQEGDERIVPMTRIRQRIAERLVQAQHTAAILTTFNEIDMTAVIELRARHKDGFEKKHGVKLGFMSFFTRASVLALGDVPALNAEIRGTNLVFRSRVHVGVAVGTDRGLVVPVVRDAHVLSLAGIEREIERLAGRARTNTLSLDELSGGTFTISNGGVYGSLLSTPILNPPQSGILGMHKIEKRPIAVNDQVVIRPMMYVALSYDHRVVDGEQAVTFLVRVKERLEDPERMLLEL